MRNKKTVSPEPRDWQAGFRRKAMKILVIDDNATHRAAAIAQLKDHNVTVVGTYDEGRDILRKNHDFEVVLADLLMPASEENQGPKGRAFLEQEMPVGIFLALLAAKNGAKYVAVFTDSDHHSHPASACFDDFNLKGENNPTPFMVEGAKTLLSNAVSWVNDFRPDDLAEKMSFEEIYKEKKQAVRAKNWLALFKHLTAM
ncbi:MAG: response regulator [Candidatus Azambacteria bacterium]|nr:response regulator [Candidatus Azambacteria bacterium]